jgi:ADP-heptose:LPS heptosyltransferase
MKTIINIDGGYGRILCAIPALIKYSKLHKDEEWYVMIPGWDIATWGIPELQERTFNPESKGIFENYYWNADKVISPEPYKVPRFYRNEISLREAFDELINETQDHSDLPEMTFKLSIDEIIAAKKYVNQIRNNNQNKKIIVFQPFGSTIESTEVGLYDRSMRSINHYMVEKIIDKLANDYVIINMNSNIYQNPKISALMPDPGLRIWAAIIQESDYFIGCDSCGQHIARAVGTNASVVIAGTHEVNVSYPEKFHIIKREGVKFHPAPMRVSMLHSMLCDKLNEERNSFTDNEIESIIKEIKKRIDKGERVTESITVKSNEVKDSKGFSK